MAHEPRETYAMGMLETAATPAGKAKTPVPRMVLIKLMVEDVTVAAFGDVVVLEFSTDCFRVDETSLFLDASSPTNSSRPIAEADWCRALCLLNEEAYIEPFGCPSRRLVVETLHEGRAVGDTARLKAPAGANRHVESMAAKAPMLSIDE